MAYYVQNCFVYFCNSIIDPENELEKHKFNWLISTHHLVVNSELKGWLAYSFVSVFEEPEDPTNRSFFSEIISSISDVKFSNSGRYMISRDYLSVKVWDLHMETKPIETYTVSLTENMFKLRKCLVFLLFSLNLLLIIVQSFIKDIIVLFYELWCNQTKVDQKSKTSFKTFFWQFTSYKIYKEVL